MATYEQSRPRIRSRAKHVSNELLLMRVAYTTGIEQQGQRDSRADLTIISTGPGTRGKDYSEQVKTPLQPEPHGLGPGHFKKESKAIGSFHIGMIHFQIFRTGITPSPAGKRSHGCP